MTTPTTCQVKGTTYVLKPAHAPCQGCVAESPPSETPELCIELGACKTFNGAPFEGIWVEADKQQPLTQARLRELMDYHPETGLFIRRVPAGTAKAGDIAGCDAGKGYIYISVDNRFIGAHRLAFLWMTGSFPPDAVDHINGVRDDNRWVNLRLATPTENSQNLASGRGASKLLGVSFYARTGKWLAQIRHNGTRINLGYHPTAEIAHAIYLAAKKKYHTHNRRIEAGL